MSARAAVLTTVLAATLAVGAAQGGAGSCSPGPSVAATVFAILLLLCMAALAFVLYLYVWRPKHVSGLEKVNLAEEGREEGRFAFDNPFLVTDDDDIGRKSTLPCDTVLSQNEKTNTARSTDSRGDRKSPFGVLSPTSKVTRRRTADDSAIAEPEKVVVPLRGHDFTGLGFNICGNMRDGILVRDVTQRGPAAESGLVKPGDRVVGLSVSFEHIVLEDALTILSYASPYEVQLHLQKASAPTPRRPQLASQGGATSQHLVHPLYRSQSHTQLHRRCWTNYPLESPQTTRSGKQGKQQKPEKNKLKPTDKQTSKAALREPRVDSELHVQREAAAHTTEAAVGYRERAVDVPDHMIDASPNSNAGSSASKYSKFGVKVLPMPELQKMTQASTHQPSDRPSSSLPPPQTASSSGQQGASGAEGRIQGSSQSKIRTFVHDAEKCGDVDRCLTMLANDVPCCKLADIETGEPLLTPQERKPPVRMGTSSFKRQNSTELDLNADISIVEGSGAFGINRDISQVRSSGEAEILLTPNAPKTTTTDIPEASKHHGLMYDTGEYTVGDYRKVEDGSPPRLGDETAPPVPPHANPAGSRAAQDSSISREARQGSASSSNSSSSGASNDNLMRMAGGAAQDRRNRADRRAADAPAHEEDTRQEETISSPSSHLSSGAAVGVHKSRPMIGHTMVPVDMGSPARTLYSGNVVMTGGEETEVTKVTWGASKDTDSVQESRTQMDKLTAFKEVLLMTPSMSISPKKGNIEEEDIVGEKVERNSAQRSPDMSAGTSRITGEVTGLVSVASLPVRQTSPERVSIANINGHTEPEESPPDHKVQPKPTPPIPPTRRLISEEGERISASTGDLSRLEERRPDSSSLERAVSLHMPSPDSPQQTASAAACEGPQMDLSQVGRCEAGVPRRAVVVAVKPVENGTTVHRRSSSSSSSSSSTSDEEEESAAGANATFGVMTTTNGPIDDHEESSLVSRGGSESVVASLAAASIPVHGLVYAESPAHPTPPPIPPTRRDLSPPRADPAPPIPAPRSTPATPRASLLVSAEGAPLAAADQREEFHITSEELDGVLISHGSYLRREAERRAQACRQAGDEVRTQHES